MKSITIATDGSCLKNPGGPTGWAYASDKGHRMIGWQVSGTNQIAELRGLLAALTDFPTGAIMIQLDSEYVLNIATKWAKGWARNGWRTRDGKPVKNLGLVKLLYMKLGARPDPITFVKVPAHTSVTAYPLNDQADRLARQGAEQAKVLYEDGERRFLLEMEGAARPLPTRDA